MAILGDEKSDLQEVSALRRFDKLWTWSVLIALMVCSDQFRSADKIDGWLPFVVIWAVIHPLYWALDCHSHAQRRYYFFGLVFAITPLVVELTYGGRWGSLWYGMLLDLYASRNATLKTF